MWRVFGGIQQCKRERHWHWYVQRWVRIKISGRRDQLCAIPKEWGLSFAKGTSFGQFFLERSRTKVNFMAFQMRPYLFPFPLLLFCVVVSNAGSKPFHVQLQNKEFLSLRRQVRQVVPTAFKPVCGPNQRLNSNNKCVEGFKLPVYTPKTKKPSYLFLSTFTTPTPTTEKQTTEFSSASSSTDLVYITSSSPALHRSGRKETEATSVKSTETLESLSSTLTQPTPTTSQVTASEPVITSTSTFIPDSTLASTLTTEKPVVTETESQIPKWHRCHEEDEAVESESKMDEDYEYWFATFPPERLRLITLREILVM